MHVCLVFVDGSYLRFSLPFAPTLLTCLSLSLSPLRRLSLRQKLLIEPRLTCLLNFLLSPPPQFLRSRDEALARDRMRERGARSRSQKFAVARVTTKYFADKHELADPRDAICSSRLSLTPLVTRSLDYRGKSNATRQSRRVGRIHAKKLN